MDIIAMLGFWSRLGEAWHNLCEGDFGPDLFWMYRH